MFVEKAKTGRAKCVVCGRLIKKGENKLVIEFGLYNTQTSRCKRCGKKGLNEMNRVNNSLIEKLTRR